MTEENQDETVENPGNAEAARYRRQLRDVEAARDGLAERIQARDRETIEARAVTHLAVASDLFDLGEVDAAELIGDDGRVDPDKVDAAAQSLLEARPGLAATPPVERLVDAWREAGNSGPAADRYADKLRELAPYLDMAAFCDDDGQISTEALDSFHTVMKGAVSPLDMGGGRRGNLDNTTAATGWRGLVTGR